MRSTCSALLCCAVLCYAPMCIKLPTVVTASFCFAERACLVPPLLTHPCQQQATDLRAKLKEPAWEEGEALEYTHLNLTGRVRFMTACAALPAAHLACTCLCIANSASTAYSTARGTAHATLQHHSRLQLSQKPTNTSGNLWMCLQSLKVQPVLQLCRGFL